MKQGRTLQELAAEIDRQRQAKKDYVADTRAVKLGLHDGAPRLRLEHGPSSMQFSIGSTAHEQLATYAGIPMPYYRRMQVEAPDLLVSSLNTWVSKREPEKKMIRTLDGKARALLSDKYRPLDNDALVEAILPPLMSLDVEMMSCEVTDTKLYLKVVHKSITKDIPTGRKLGDGSHTFFDTVCPAMVISNSEVGLGALSVKTAIFTRMCTNLAVVGERSSRRYHVGQRMDIGEDTYTLLSDQTRRLTDAALWAQIGDVVKAAFDKAQFDVLADRLGAAAEDEIKADPVKVVEVTAKKFMWSTGEQSSVLQHLIRGGDLTKYGLHAAITRASADVESYDRASQLEELGGKIIELPQNEWRELALAA